jgi:hypothetical protein
MHDAPIALRDVVALVGELAQVALGVGEEEEG